MGKTFKTVHMEHCNKGEYDGVCKYNIPNQCPALDPSLKIDASVLASTKSPVTSKDILRVLQVMAKDRGHMVFFEELRIGTGYGKDNEQRLDGWQIDLYPSHRLERITFEVKISRSDYLLEIKDPRKRRYGLIYSNRFYFVAPKGMLKIEEIPVECGLMEYEDGDIRTKLLAPWRDSIMPTWNFVASLSRRIGK